MSRFSASTEQRVDRLGGELGLRDEAARRAVGYERPEIAAVETRGEDHLQRQVKRGELLCNVEAVDVWQLHVNDDEIWLRVRGQAERRSRPLRPQQ